MVRVEPLIGACRFEDPLRGWVEENDIMEMVGDDGCRIIHIGAHPMA